MNLESFKKQCLDCAFVIELIQLYNPSTFNQEESDVFFECLNQVAGDNITILEDLFFKEDATKEEDILLARLLVDLKTSSKIMKLKFRTDLSKILAQNNWLTKLNEFTKNQNPDWRVDSKDGSIHFTMADSGKRVNIPNFLWTHVVEKIISRDSPFFYIFALATIEDEDILVLKNAFMYYLSKNLIKH